MKKLLSVTAIVLTAIMLVCLLSGSVYAFVVTSDSHLDESLLPVANSPTVYYDANGDEMASSAGSYAEFEELPTALKDAFVACEDKRFYSHKGYDTRRIVKAAANNLKTDSFSEGASTITQQLVKNTHLSQEKTVRRKLKELKIARELEKEYEKDEILTMYLNVAYFGKGNYGVTAAAENIFGKSVADLSVSECAALAATVKNPSAYCPLIDAEKSTERRNLVLRLMHEQGYLDDTTFASATAETLETSTAQSTNRSSVTEYVRAAAEEICGRFSITRAQLDLSGWKIYTSFVPESQAILDNAAESGAYAVPNASGEYPDTCIMLAESSTGAVQAMYSNRYAAEKLRRQSGSVLKPLAVYAPALENGIVSPATQLVDERTDFGGFSPKNYNDVYLGVTNTREAVAKSLNVPAVKLLTYLGADKSAAALRNMGVSVGGTDETLALALGATESGVSTSELLGGYTALSCGGIAKTPHFVTRIVTNEGTKYVYESEGKLVFGEDTAYLMTDMLKSAVSTGTARSLSTLSFDIAAKTGTVGSSGGNSDAWCASYTSEHVLLAWHGNGDGSEESLMSTAETGGAYVTLLSRAVWSKLYEGRTPPADFETPQSVVSAKIDTYELSQTGVIALASDNTPQKYCKEEIFSRRYLPSSVSTVFTNMKTELAAQYNEGTVTLTFTAKDALEYVITKRVQVAGRYYSSRLKTIKNQNGAVTVKDYVFPRNNYIEYTLTPVLENGDNRREGEQTSARIFAPNRDFSPF